MTAPQSPTSMERLEAKIDSLSEIVNERLKNLDEKVESGSLNTRQTIQALSEVVNTMARSIESTYQRRDVYELAQRGVEIRIAKMEDRQTWIARTSISALVLPVLVVIITAALIATGITT